MFRGRAFQKPQISKHKYLEFVNIPFPLGAWAGHPRKISYPPGVWVSDSRDPGPLSCSSWAQGKSQSLLPLSARPHSPRS